MMLQVGSWRESRAKCDKVSGKIPGSSIRSNFFKTEAGRGLAPTPYVAVGGPNPLSQHMTVGKPVGGIQAQEALPQELKRCTMLSEIHSG